MYLIPVFLQISSCLIVPLPVCVSEGLSVCVCVCLYQTPVFLCSLPLGVCAFSPECVSATVRTVTMVRAGIQGALPAALLLASVRVGVRMPGDTTGCAGRGLWLSVSQESFVGVLGKPVLL